MSREENINCDNTENCNGGKYFKTDTGGHDICSLCEIKIKTKYYCPLCLKNGELK